ncbi:hypothetical protein BU14_0237s0022 [Porphyra umbilicalis]|uniref:Uncharacterized protein n=1 Tax=Porphyra umbilicalis TaxID=2786 RepID=A0A1X6P3G7_PORUM|nr:hypothetical protein BU14_0237s0022 [Porphyra umbilicalis]|eukprot:OSX75429.1 hypothetical protein BU14_0237s0022 [Porphyra umbilicalis]
MGRRCSFMGFRANRTACAGLPTTSSRPDGTCTPPSSQATHTRAPRGRPSPSNRPSAAATRSPPPSRATPTWRRRLGTPRRRRGTPPPPPNCLRRSPPRCRRSPARGPSTPTSAPSSRGATPTRLPPALTAPRGTMGRLPRRRCATWRASQGRSWRSARRWGGRRRCGRAPWGVAASATCSPARRCCACTGRIGDEWQWPSGRWVLGPSRGGRRPTGSHCRVLPPMTCLGARSPPPPPSSRPTRPAAPSSS